MSGPGRKPRGTKHNTGSHTEGQVPQKVLGRLHPNRHSCQHPSAGPAVSMRSTTGKSRDVLGHPREKPLGLEGGDQKQGIRKSQKSRPTSSLKAAGSHVIWQSHFWGYIKGNKITISKNYLLSHNTTALFTIPMI